MLESAIQGNEVHLNDVSAEALECFIRALQGDLSMAERFLYRDCEQSVRFAVRFQCMKAASTMLFACTRELLEDKLLPAFTLASDLNDIRSAVRILGQGYRAYPRYISRTHLQPEDTSKPWTAETARSIRSDWTWALTSAIYRIEKRFDVQSRADWAKPDVWAGVVGNFATNLSRCRVFDERNWIKLIRRNVSRLVVQGGISATGWISKLESLVWMIWRARLMRTIQLSCVKDAPGNLPHNASSLLLTRKFLRVPAHIS